MKKGLKVFLLVITVILLCGYISAEWLQFMLIQGDSMLPSYHNMQLVVLKKHDREYHIGDVIAFQCEGLSVVLVKRIAACGGDTVRIDNGTLYVNGKTSVLYQEGAFEYSGILEAEVTLLCGEYIVIGDNLTESKDSRDERVGIVREENIIGKVWRD